MENLNNIYLNKQLAELNLIKIVLKLEMEFQDNKTSAQMKKYISHDIENLKHTLKVLNELYVLEEKQKEEIKFY